MITLRAVILRKYGDHEIAEVVVTVDSPHNYETHQVGVDIQLNRGKVITFIGGIYGIPPGEVVWPEHVALP